MKKNYQAPHIEKVKFCYKDQVVASGPITCTGVISYAAGADPQICYSDPQTVWNREEH